MTKVGELIGYHVDSPTRLEFLTPCATTKHHGKKPGDRSLPADATQKLPPCHCMNISAYCLNRFTMTLVVSRVLYCLYFYSTHYTSRCASRGENQLAVDRLAIILVTY